MTDLIIVDTSALISLFSPKDQNNKIAKKISSDIKHSEFELIIPGEIFTETVNVFGKKENHDVAVKHGKFLLETSEFKIAETTFDIRLKAFEKFNIQPKSVSYTDCLVMVFADEYETKTIFGFDFAFSKNGYKRLGIDK